MRGCILLQPGEPCDVDQRVRRFDNVYCWFRTNAQPLRDPSGRVIRWYGIATEIEDLKRAEEGLREREQNLRLVVDSIPGLVCTMNASGEVQRLNRQLLEYFGKTPEELKNWGTTDVVHPDDLSRVLAAFTSSVETGHPYEIEHRFRRADGVYLWFQVRALRCGTRKDTSRWYVLHTDIDKRKQAEDRLQLLLDVTNQVVSNLQLRDLSAGYLGKRPARHAMRSGGRILARTSEGNRMQTFVLDFPERKDLFEKSTVRWMNRSVVLSSVPESPGSGNASDVLQLGLEG